MAQSHTDTEEGDGDVPWNESACVGIVGTTGKQCGSHMRNDEGLCGNHDSFGSKGSPNRVDSYGGAVDAELRDEIVELDLPGRWAYAFAVACDSIEGVWSLVSGAEDVVVGDVLLSRDDLAQRAPDVARHSELDVDDHPLADERCISVIDEGSLGEDYRCPTRRYGLELLCGGHQNANDPRIALDESGYLDELPSVWVAGDEILVVEQRGDDVIGLDPESWRLDRFKKGDYLAPEEVDDFEPASGLADVDPSGLVEDDQEDDEDQDDRVAVWAEQAEAGDRIRFARESVNADDPIEAEGDVLEVGVVEGEYAPTGTPEIVVEDEDREDRTFVLWPAWSEVRARYSSDGSPDERQIGELVDVEILEDADPIESWSETAVGPPPRPPLLEGIDEGDEIDVELESGDVLSGTVVDTGTGGWSVPENEAHFSVYLDDVGDVRDSLIVESHRDSDGSWSDVVAADLEFLGDDQDDRRRDLGTVVDVRGGTGTTLDELESDEQASQDVDERLDRKSESVDDDQEDDEPDPEVRRDQMFSESEAKLLELVAERIDVDELRLDYDLARTPDVEDVAIPVRVAREGKALMATFLSAHCFSRTEIADALDVSKQTVSQYITDVRNGRR